MPKLEAKQVQKELEQGQLWPVYWLYGQERMKARELLKRIRKAALGEAETPEAASFLQLNEELHDGAEVDGAAVADAARSMSLGGGLKFIVVRDAHAMKNPEAIVDLLGPKAIRTDLPSVCVFVSKDLDGRKKISKTLTEKAAVISCEEVAEPEREAWAQYLAKRRGRALSPELLLRLIALDPWTLDIVEQELEKLDLGEAAGVGDEVMLHGASTSGGSDAFLDAFFRRDLSRALDCVHDFTERPDESLPLLGLLAWNVRQLAVLIADREQGTRNAKLNPYLAEKLRAWGAKWSLAEVIRLQAELEDLDFGMKQTPLLPLGLWDSLVMGFCGAQNPTARG